MRTRYFVVFNWPLELRLTIQSEAILYSTRKKRQEYSFTTYLSLYLIDMSYQQGQQGYYQQGPPPGQGYYQQGPPPGQGYYQQGPPVVQQPIYVQQAPPPQQDDSCCGTCMKTLLCCCLLDMLCGNGPWFHRNLQYFTLLLHFIYLCTLFFSLFVVLLFTSPGIFQFCHGSFLTFPFTFPLVTTHFNYTIAFSFIPWPASIFFCNI